MKVTNTSITTYHIHVVDVETENDTYSVVFTENDFAWDIRVLNVDTCDEVEENDPIYNIVVSTAESAVWNEPEQDSAGFTQADRNSI